MTTPFAPPPSSPTWQESTATEEQASAQTCAYCPNDAIITCRAAGCHMPLCGEHIVRYCTAFKKTCSTTCPGGVIRCPRCAGGNGRGAHAQDYAILRDALLSKLRILFNDGDDEDEDNEEGDE